MRSMRESIESLNISRVSDRRNGSLSRHSSLAASSSRSGPSTKPLCCRRRRRCSLRNNLTSFYAGISTRSVRSIRAHALCVRSDRESRLISRASLKRFLIKGTHARRQAATPERHATPLLPQPQLKLKLRPSCVKKLCKLGYDRAQRFQTYPTSSKLEEQIQVQRRLQRHLEAHYPQHLPLASPSTATRVTLGHFEKEEGGREGEESDSVLTLEGGVNERESESESGGVERYVFSRPWHLAVMGWDCQSECKYSCMTMHVETMIEAGQRVQQYYGKWPFRRVWGIQELFASLFSAGNGLPHLYHLLFSRGQYNPPGNYMRFWLTLYPWVGINTWLWSTVFHARDLRWTEAADYFCALLNIFFVVWVAIVRTAGPARKRRPGVFRLVRWLGVSMSVYYVLHISFMWFVKFDYGYNMKVALVASLVHTALWLVYQYQIRDRPYAMRGVGIL